MAAFVLEVSVRPSGPPLASGAFFPHKHIRPRPHAGKIRYVRFPAPSCQREFWKVRALFFSLSLSALWDQQAHQNKEEEEEEEEEGRGRGSILLQKLAEILADVLASGPLAHAVTVQGMGAAAVFV